MENEMDILKEVGGIAAGHGSIALSEILGRKISLEVPSTDVIICHKLPASMHLEKIGIAVYCKLLVGLQGEAAFILDEKNAYKLIDISCKLKKSDKRAGVLTEMGMSFMKEIGNVVIGAYVNALNLMLRRVIIPPIPTLISGPIDHIINILLAPYKREDYAYLIEAVFAEPRENLRGSFYLILTPDAAKDIKETCEKLLREINEH